MIRPFAAALAELLHRQLLGNRLGIAIGVIIAALANGTHKFDEMFLGHGNVKILSDLITPPNLPLL